MDFRQIKVSEDDFGLMTYDPAFTNTASVPQRDHLHRRRGRRARVPRLPDRAAVRAVHATSRSPTCSIYGELPTQEQLDEWIHEITHHTYVHENIKKFVEGFRYDAHPMGMLLATVGALSTFYPDAKHIDDEIERHMATVRLIAKMPTLAAFAYRHNLGLPYVYPDNDLVLPRQLPLDDVQDDGGQVRARPAARARARRALDPARRPRAELLDERGARRRLVARSTRTRRWPPASPRSTGRCTAAPTRRCCGCSTGSSTADNIPDFLEGVKNREEKLMGFGHRVYKNYDPRARDHQEARGRGVRGDGQEPEARHRRRAREARARRRLLHRAQALPERRLLLGPDLRGAQPAARHVHGDVRDPAHVRLDRAVARDGRRPGAEDRPAAPDLHGRARAELRADRGPREEVREAARARRT